MPKLLAGLHHITAIASDPQRSLDFYTGVLGLRLVKLTVNSDDPDTYHLCYGDAKGTPGTILTFFPWPDAARGRQGSGQATAIALAVPAGSLNVWHTRLAAHHASEQQPRFGEMVITFQDPDGLPLELIGVPGDGEAILGMYSVTVTERRAPGTEGILAGDMGFDYVGQEDNRFRWQVGEGGPGATIDVLAAPAEAPGHVAAGTVHHAAWRTPDDDLPGFAVDESPEMLRARLMLPPQYEPQRAQIERRLPSLRLPRTKDTP